MPKPTWNIRRFCLLHLSAFLLLLSLFWCPWTQTLWQHIDTFVFRTLNDSLIDHPLQQLFWAYFNIKLTDLYGAVYMVSLFVVFIFEAEGSERKRRTASFLFTLLWFEITILVCKQVLTPICEHSHISRHSPTVCLDHFLPLSQVIPFLPVKDSSYFCFPADHGTIVLQWWLLFTYFAGPVRGALAFIPTFFLMLPRLISGAHWFSDLIVGSVSIILFAFAYATCTPLYAYLYRFFCRVVRVPVQEVIFLNDENKKW